MNINMLRYSALPCLYHHSLYSELVAKAVSKDEGLGILHLQCGCMEMWAKDNECTVPSRCTVSKEGRESPHGCLTCVCCVQNCISYHCGVSQAALTSKRAALLDAA